MIGFLRFIGIMNAAVWFGATVLFVFGAGPACFSNDMRTALGLGPGTYVYPNAIELVVMSRYFHVALACGVVALLHLLAEWLYMGRPARKFSFGLIAGMFILTLIGADAIRPKLTDFNKDRYSATLSPAARESAAKSFRVLNTMVHTFNVLVMGGLVVYLWRVANPSDTLRFVSPVKFRG